MVAIVTEGLNEAWGWLRKLRSRQQTPIKLRDFETEAHRQTELFGPLNRRSIGLRNVEVSRILGSVGRSGEFNGNFQPPLSAKTEQARFRRVVDAMKKGELLPPIELYKLRQHYYILDGHHRVGAARLIGVQSIDAEITLFIPSGDPVEMRLFHERRAFEQATGLQSIGGARPITYRRLLTEVHTFRRELAEHEGAETDLQFAARLWYARVFLPAFAAIRAARLQEYFPMQRHADMVAALFDEERTARRRRAQDPLLTQAELESEVGPTSQVSVQEVM